MVMKIESTKNKRQNAGLKGGKMKREERYVSLNARGQHLPRQYLETQKDTNSQRSSHYPLRMMRVLKVKRS
jgi:hypothetical protein